MRKPDLTIFQKMLLAPLAGVLLYSAYLVFVTKEQEITREAIDDIRSTYLPMLEIATENVILFDTITESFKDAVQAGEEAWVQNTRNAKGQVEGNLESLRRYNSLISDPDVAGIASAFERYYENAYTLSMAMLHQQPSGEETNRLIENVARYHTRVSHDLRELRSGLRIRISTHIDETRQRLQREVVVATVLGIVLTIIVVGITIAASFSTRKSLRAVNQGLKNIAQEDPDFSRRLTCESRDELGELVGWFNHLSDKLENYHRQIEMLSITDKLTQLYNRTKIDELFDAEIDRVRRYHQALTIILMDLDHFKSVNDTYGHQVGDRVLEELADILRGHVRSCDHLGRWGGEEFVILSANTNLVEGRQLAEKLRKAIAGFAFSEVGEKTASFGIATYRDGDDQDTMTRRADDSLYAAKMQGRNRVVDETQI